MNVILLVSDTFRYDNLFDRAAMPVRTPCLDRFAQRAVSLSRLYVSSFPTIPHRTDLISGRFGWPWYPWQALAGSTQNRLPSLLGQKGYVSQLICDCPHLFPNGFNQAFNAAYALRGQEGDMALLKMNHAMPHVMDPEKTRSSLHFAGRNLVDMHRWHNRDWRLEEDRFPPRTARAAVEWLEENYRQDPFLLWVDFFDPHEPWDPPEYMVRRYDPDYDGTPMLHPNYGKASDYTRAELRNLRAHYCAESELVDRWVGRILEKIDDLDLWQNTVVVFTTDHGMSLGEHNRTGKSNIHHSDNRYWPIYPEIAHIPCMIAAPGLEGGRTVDALLQPPDIAPTLLDLAGVKLKPPEPFHGRSFAPLLRGRSRRPLRELAIAGQFRRPVNGKPPRNSMTPVLYTKRWAYVPKGARGRRELYDLRADRLAAKNVLAQHPRVADRLHAAFGAWLAEMDAPEPARAVWGF